MIVNLTETTDRRSASPETWRHLDSGRCPPAYNMGLDEALFEAAGTIGSPVLRFYGWTEPAATFGYAQPYVEVERLTPLRPLIRRPSGGGVVPHDRDWTYTFVVPAPHAWYGLRARDSYARMHDWLRRALLDLGIDASLAPVARTVIPGACFAGAEQFDVLWRGAKIAGAAQRRNRRGLLIQGSVQPPPGVARAEWQRAMLEVAGRTWGVVWQPWNLSHEVSARADALAAGKYSQTAYNRRR